MTWLEVRECMRDYIDVANAKMPSELRRYDYTCVFDENKSVKWNREEVERHNTIYEESRKSIEDNKRNARYQFECAIVEYISEVLGIDEDHAQKIYDHCYAEKHAFGIKEVADYVDDLIEVLE